MNIPCQYHKGENLIYFIIPTLQQLESNQKQYFKCPRCITEESYLNCRSLILLSDIFQKSSNDYLQNWPILEGEQEELQPHPKRKILSLVFSNQIHQQSIENNERIKLFFVNLKDKVIHKLNMIEEMIIQNQNQMIEKADQIKQKYKSINNIQDLKNIIIKATQEQNDKDQIQKLLDDFILSQKQSDNINHIAAQLNSFENRMTFSIEKNLERIEQSFQNQLKIIEYHIEQEIKKCSSEIKPLTEQENNIKYFMKLISNKTNYCNIEFLQDMESFFHQNQIVFQNFDVLHNLEKQNNCPIDFSHLSDKQLDQFKKLINLQSYIEENLTKNNLEDSSIRTAEFLQKLKENFSPKTYHQLKQIFYEYPVIDLFDKFPLEENIHFNRISSCDLNEINILIQQLEDTKSYENIINQYTFTESVNYKGMKIQNLDSSIQFNQNSRALQKCYSKQILENNSVYSVKFRIKQMQRQGNGHILVGLIPDELKDKQMHEQDLQKTFVWNNGNGCKDLMKGSNFYEIKGPNTIFTIYFSIKNKFFFVSDNLNVCINYNNDAKYFEEKSYRLGISINNGFRDQTLEILEFKKLNI